MLAARQDGVSGSVDYPQNGFKTLRAPKHSSGELTALALETRMFTRFFTVVVLTVGIIAAIPTSDNAPPLVCNSGDRFCCDQFISPDVRSHSDYLPLKLSCVSDCTSRTSLQRLPPRFYCWDSTLPISLLHSDLDARLLPSSGGLAALQLMCAVRALMS